MRSTVKYIVYALASILLLALPFLLLPLPVFSADDLNPLLLLFIIDPLVLLLQGIISELFLCGKPKLVYIIIAPLIGIIFMIAFYFAVGNDTAFGGPEVISLIRALFTYPMTIFSIIYVISPWLGIAAVKIFKKLRVVLSPLFKYEK